MELYLSDHPSDCAGCERGQLRDAAARARRRAGRGALRARAAPRTWPRRPTSRTPTSPTTRRPASSARGACGPAPRPRAPSRSPCRGRGFDSRITPGGTDFLSSECVSCGACVQACPTDALTEKSVVSLGMPTRSVVTTCAYCGVGLLVQGRGAGLRRRDPGRADGAVEGRRRQRGPLVRQGPLRLRLRLAPRPAAVADGARLDRRRVAGRVVGAGHRADRRPASSGCARSTASVRSAASRRRGAPTRRSTSSRRWCGRRSATTTSTPARGSATPPPATG